MIPNEFNALCKFVQDNEFKVVIVEGPRGVGKTTFCRNLLEKSDLVYYKTWGGEQKNLRKKMAGKLSLDLPQGTYFVLDFVKQVPLERPVLADRGNISAIVYQRDLPYGQNTELHKYYVDLMRDSRALMLVLTGPEDDIAARRISRGSDDEESLHTRVTSARRFVEVDCQAYDEAVDKMVSAGLENVASFDLDEGFTCWAYTATGMEVKLPPEVIYEDED